MPVQSVYFNAFFICCVSQKSASATRANSGNAKGKEKNWEEGGGTKIL